jgi:hypothetical protein
MNHADYGYGLWSLVIMNSLVFIIFAFSFTKPRSKKIGVLLECFQPLVALFTNVWISINNLFANALACKDYPGIDFLNHDSGHLLEVIFGWRTNPHFGPFHLLSNIFIILGFFLLASAWSAVCGCLIKYCDNGAVFEDQASTVCCICCDHVWVLASVADTDNLDDVSDIGLYLFSFGI